MAFLVPAYAQTQSGILQQDRDQDCIPEGPATRAYGEPPTQAQEEKPEVSEEELEEELRLMYVAATRAKDNLFFTYPGNVYDRSTGLVLSRPSRYLDNMPDDILEKQFEYR
jgi:superfamily I DNA/RNA helicase